MKKKGVWSAMKGRKWIRIKATEWDGVQAELMDLRERADKNAKLTQAWVEHASECQRECNDSQAYIKELEADLERVRTELVEYKRMYADEVEKRITGLAMLLNEGKEMSIEDELRHPVSGGGSGSAGE